MIHIQNILVSIGILAPFIFGFCLFRSVYGYFHFGLGILYTAGLYMTAEGISSPFDLVFVSFIIAMFLITHFGLFEQLKKRGADPGRLLIVTLAFYLVCEQLFSIYFSDSISFPKGDFLSDLEVPFFRSFTTTVIAIFGIFTCLISWIILAKTELGAKINAIIENETLAKSFNINVERLKVYVLLIIVLLVLLAGALNSYLNGAFPRAGFAPVVLGFAVSLISRPIPVANFILISIFLVVAQYSLFSLFPTHWANITTYLFLLFALIIFTWQQRVKND